MGDRVAVIGGQVVGHDHFPFPAPTTPPFGGYGDGTIRPIGIPLDDMCEFFYRVKKWRFSLAFNYDVNADDGMGGFTLTSGAGNIQFDLVPNVRTDASSFTPIAFTREGQVVLPRFTDALVFTLYFDGTVVVPDGTNTWMFDISNASGSASYDDASGRFLLQGTINLNLCEMVYDSGFFPILVLRIFTDDGSVFFRTDSALGSDVGFIYLNSDHLLQATLRGQGSPPPSSNSYVYITLDGPATLDAVEWWPYAARDGSPIYNTSDGSQLQSPFN